MIHQRRVKHRHRIPESSCKEKETNDIEILVILMMLAEK